MSRIFIDHVTPPPMEQPRTNDYTLPVALPFAEQIQRIVLALQSCGWRANGVTTRFGFAGDGANRFGHIASIIEDNPNGTSLAFEYASDELRRFSISGPECKLTVYTEGLDLRLEQYVGKDWPRHRAEFIGMHAYPTWHRQFNGSISDRTLRCQSPKGNLTAEHEPLVVATVLGQFERYLLSLEARVLRTPAVDAPVDVFGAKPQLLPPRLLPDVEMPVYPSQAMSMVRRWSNEQLPEDKHILIDPTMLAHAYRLGLASDEEYFGFDWSTPVSGEVNFPELRQLHKPLDSPDGNCFLARIQLKWANGLWVVDTGIPGHAVPLALYVPDTFAYPQLLVFRPIHPDEVIDVYGEAENSE